MNKPNEICGEEFLASGQERGVCQLPKKHKGSHDNTVRRAEPPSEASVEGEKEAAKWTEAELQAAETQVCVGGREAGIAFFRRHPNLGFRMATELQCELNAAKSAYQRGVADGRRQAVAYLESPSLIAKIRALLREES